MYCVMRASAPSLYNVYRRYDTCFRDALSQFLKEDWEFDRFLDRTCTVYIYGTPSMFLARVELVRVELVLYQAFFHAFDPMPSLYMESIDAMISTLLAEMCMHSLCTDL